MKIRLLLILLLTGASLALAQSNYPLVTIHDIQFIDSADTKGFVASPLTNDTVRVRGVVMIRPLVDPTTNRQTVMYYGNRWGSYIQDSSGQEWAGLNVLLNDTTTAGAQNTFFDLVDSSDIVELTGYVSTYGATNELMLVTDPAIPVNIVGKLPKRPDPLQLNVTDFMDSGKTIYGSLKYSGMYVELHNVISSDRNTSSGGFRINDANGNYLTAYPQSRYFRLDQYKMPGATYQVPQDGTPINSIRGIITFYGTTYEILPIYPEDLYITVTPPVISNIKRDKIQVGTNQTVTIAANISDLDGVVKSAALHYRVGKAARVAVTMDRSTSDTTLYTATIPAASTDSTMVDYFVTAKDNDGLTGYTPSDTVNGNYFYQVLDGTLKIRDVQYSPFGSGYSGYNGYYVTLSGIVTADTSDYPGKYSSNYPTRVYMQDGSGPWTGIMIGMTGMKGTDVQKLKSGDNVTITGKIMEIGTNTKIDSLTQITVNSSGNPLPAAATVKTSVIAKSGSGVVNAEQWEGVLVSYQNVTVSDENADGNVGPLVSGVNNNYGEMFVSDGSGDTRVSLQDGNNNYENFWSAAFETDSTKVRITTGSKFSEISGILYYSFSNFKLCPRKASDFVGFVPTDVKKDVSVLPAAYKLEQNYPNPFNPSTMISFSIPKESMVTLKIFNILGQEVKTLVKQNKLPGKYSVSFNANNFSSGIYFYSLSAGNYYQVKKMLLLK